MVDYALLSTLVDYLVYDISMTAVDRVDIATRLMLQSLVHHYGLTAEEVETLRRQMADLDTLADWVEAFTESPEAVKAQMYAWRCTEGGEQDG